MITQVHINQQLIISINVGHLNPPPSRTLKVEQHNMEAQHGITKNPYGAYTCVLE